MVRATAARVLIAIGGSYPTGWAEAAVTNLCQRADYIIDGYVKRWGTAATLSATDNDAIEVAVDLVLHLMWVADMMKRSRGMVAGEGMAYPAQLNPFPKWIKERIDILMGETGIELATTVRQVENE